MVRVTLKHLLPIALLVTSTLAQSDTTDDSVSKTAEESEATGKTTATATATKTEDSAKSTATGTKSDAEKTTEKATTTEVEATFTWNPTQPATTAPDILGGASRGQDSKYLVLTVVVGVLTMGMVMA